MASPAEIVGDRLAGTASRRGFLAALGKMALLGGAALAALGGKEVYAICGPSRCPKNNQYSCPSGDMDSYYSCCKTGSQYYETRLCESYNPSCGCYNIFDCFYSFGPVGPNCPNVPAP